MKPALKIILLVLAILFVCYLHLWGIDRLVMGSDELHPARTLISSDWSLVNYPWPEQAVREYYDNWPIQFPPLFGLSIRACVVLIGVNHVAMRLIPALFSLLAVWSFYWLFKTYLGRTWGAVAALTLGMTSDKLLIYAKSLKHYTLDVFFASTLWVCGRYVGEKFDLKSWILFTLVAAVSIWFAFAALYVVAAVYLYLFVRYVWFKAYRQQQFWTKILISGAVFTASFAGLYLVSIAKAVTNPVFIQEWLVQIFHWDKLTDLGYVAHYILHTGKHVLILPAYFFFDAWWVAIIGNALILIWIVDRLRRRNWDLVFLMVSPLLLVLMASLAGKYPFSAGRLTLFLLPSWSLMMILGGRIVYERIRAWNLTGSRIAVGILVLVILWAVDINFTKVTRLKYAGGRRVDQMMYTLKEQARDGDTVYLHWGSILPFYFYYTDHQPGYQSVYTTPADSGQLHVIWGEEHTLHPERNIPLFNRIENVPGRLWIAFGHLWPTADMLQLKEQLDNHRVLLKEIKFKGCRLLLYDRLDQSQKTGELSTLESKE